MVRAFPLIGKWLVRKNGGGNKVKIGGDPWLGCSENFRLSCLLVNILHNKEIFSLGDAAKPEANSLSSQGWKSDVQLGIQEELAETKQKQILGETKQVHSMQNQ